MVKRKNSSKRNLWLLKLKGQKSIDPHFSENKKFFSPIARFEPTLEGEEMAIRMCESMKDYGRLSMPSLNALGSNITD